MGEASGREEEGRGESEALGAAVAGDRDPGLKPQFAVIAPRLSAANCILSIALWQQHACVCVRCNLCVFVCVYAAHVCVTFALHYL